MTDITAHTNPEDSPHAWVHEHLGAYLAAGLNAEERQRFDAHINSCADCFDAFTEARDADRTLLRALGGLTANPDLEQKTLTHFRENTMKRLVHPMLRRAGYAAAACIALAATGVFANFVLHTDGKLNNPFSERMVAKADAAAPALNGRIDQLTYEIADARWWNRGKQSPATPNEITQTPPGSKGMSRPLPGVDLTKVMQFTYNDAPMSTVVQDMARRFGFVIANPGQLPTTRVTVQNMKEVDASEALRLVNEMLVPMGYVALATSTASDPSAHSQAQTVLRVVTTAESKKANVAVYKGANPNDIPLNDELRTQVIPLNSVNASNLVPELRAMVSADADIGASSSSNAIVVTDTSAKIRRLAEVIQNLDSKKSDAVVQYRTLANGNAADAAREINAMNSAGAAGGRGDRGGDAPTGRVYADVDSKTNTLVLSGPATEVQKALETANELEEKADLARAAKDYDSIMQRPAEAAKLKAREGQQTTLDVGNGALAYNDPSKAVTGTRATASNEVGFEMGALDSRARTEINGNAIALGPTAGTNFGKAPDASNKWSYATNGTSTPPSINLNADSGRDGRGGGGGGFGGAGFAGGAAGPEGGKATFFNGGGQPVSSPQIVTVAGSTPILGNIPTNGQAANRTPTDALNIYGNPTDARDIGGNALALGDAGKVGGWSYNARHEVGNSIQSGGVIVDGGTQKQLGVSAADKGYIASSNGTDHIENRTFNGTIDGTSSLTKTGSGTMTLSAGQVAISSGALLTNQGGQQADKLDDSLKKAEETPVARDRNAQSAAQDQPARYRVEFSDEEGGLKLKANDIPPGNWQNDAAPTGQDRAALSSYTFQKANPGTTGVPGSIAATSALKPDFTVRTSKDQLAVATTPAASQSPPARNAAAPAAAAQPPAPQQAPEIAAGLKIIKNGTMEFEVASFNDAYGAVRRVALEEHGFVASTSSDKLANGKVRGTIVVRVPPENLDSFLQGLRALGDLKAQQIGAQDVTKDYYDIASELRGLETMESRLLDLIKNGKGEVKDLIAAETQLGDTRVKIERLKGQISYYDNLVSLCTITITAYEKDITTPTAASEQEIVGLNVETEQVEAKYQAARKIFEDAKGRIVESQLKNTDADHVAAHIVAEVPPDQADFVAGQLKQLGKVASFNRDRKQTTTGGTGGPGPNVEVEHKDTRITIDLFNLANMQPRETTVLRVAVTNVETAYADVLSRVRKDAPDAGGHPPGAPGIPAEAPGIPAVPPGIAAVPPGIAAVPPGTPALPPGTPATPTQEAPRTVGHIVASSLNGQQPEQMSADIRAEVRAESADDILNAIRAYGEVEYSSLANNPDNASTTSAKRGIQLTLVNIASVPPKEINSVTIAVPNVEQAYNTLLQAIRKPAPGAPEPPRAPQLMPATVGRVLNSGITGQRPEEMVGDIRAEIREDQADDVLRLTKASGELLSTSTTDSPDNAIATAVKRGLVVRFTSVAAVNAREAQQIRAVALDVPSAYQKLLASLQSLAAKDGTGPGGGVHIVTSSLNGGDRRTMAAHFTFDAPRTADADIARAFADAGIDFLTRNIVRSTDTANTLDSKVRYQIDEIRSAESLDPRRTYMLTEEVPDVDKAVSDLKAVFPSLEFNVSHPEGGVANAHALADLSVEDSRNARMAIANLRGIEKDNQVINNNNVPDTKFARERIDVTFTGEVPIVKKDQGVDSAFRAAMTTVSGVLFESIYLIIVGLVFILPFALILWPIWRVIRRRRAAVGAA